MNRYEEDMKTIEEVAKRGSQVNVIVNGMDVKLLSYFLGFLHSKGYFIDDRDYDKPIETLFFLKGE